MDDLDVEVAQLAGGMDHERGFAHLSGREHMAVFAVQECLKQLLVGLAFDVGGGVEWQGALSFVEAHRVLERIRGWRSSEGQKELQVIGLLGCGVRRRVCNSR